MAQEKAQPAQTSSGAWPTRSLLRWIAEAFANAHIESPRLCAELLVSHCLGCDRLRLYVDPDRPASAQERQTLRDLVVRALAHEPVQYLVGQAWFFSLPLMVDRRALIPRPETETLVQGILQHARTTPSLAKGVIADIGTGSGCIIISILKNLPEAHGVATDLSPDAIELARENAFRHGALDRLDLLTGNLLEPLEDHPAGRSLQCLISNPPYIPDSEWENVPANLKHEPLVALRGGADGLQFIRPILEQAADFLAPGGLVAIEFAESTADAVLELARRQPLLCDARIEADFQGRPRALFAHRAG